MPRAHQFGLVAVVGLALLVPAPASAGLSGLDRHIVVAQSAAAGGKIDRRRLLLILAQACSVLQVDESAVPQIVFIRLREDEARAGGVPPGVTVMVERSSLTIEQARATQPARYLVWLVGEPGDGKLVGAVAHVLRMDLRRDLSDADLLTAEKRIVRRLDATVDTSAFVK